MTAPHNHWFIIVNPKAGNGQGKKAWPKIQKQLDELGYEYLAVHSKAAGHAMQLVHEGVAQGYQRIMAVGGDGTNNEVINGILSQDTVPSSEITYTLLPVGTGNDWIKTYQIPKNIPRWLKAIKEDNTRLQDIGLVTYYHEGQQQKRYFTNVAGMAYDAYLVEKIGNLNLKFGGQFIYLFYGLKCMFEYNLRKAKVTFDGQTVEDHFYTINVGICRYSGGGMQLVPHAVPDDGQFALTLVRQVSKLDVLINTPRFYNGKLDRHPKITLHQAKNIKIEAIDDLPTLLEVDGEFIGETPVEYTLLEKALRIVVPSNYQS